MGSKERIAREKIDIREKILNASMEIIIDEGCLALSMRKIADRVEYAASTIYEYFANKDAILIALTNNGYSALSKMLTKEQKEDNEPLEILQKMWKAYWDFAFKNEELYKLMFGIQISCPKPEGEIANLRDPETIIISSIKKLKPTASNDEIKQTYYAMLSFIHGLISFNIVVKKKNEEFNIELLSSTIKKLI